MPQTLTVPETFVNSCGRNSVRFQVATNMTYDLALLAGYPKPAKPANIGTSNLRQERPFPALFQS
jgi:hypothetical protein